MRKLVEVILAENTELGKKWEIKKIKPGFYRNHLSSKENIWLYNQQNWQRMERMKKQERALALLKEEKAKELYEKINNLDLFFSLKKDKNGKVFGSIRAEDILKEMKNLGFLLKEKQLIEFSSLTNLGDNWVKIKLSENLIAQVKINIILAE